MGEYERNGWRATGSYLAGRFEAPEGYHGAPMYTDENGDLVADPIKGMQFWRRWLAGVKAIFELVRVELDRTRRRLSPCQRPRPFVALDVLGAEAPAEPAQGVGVIRRRRSRCGAA